MKHLTPKHLRELAALCCGVTLLVVLALALSQGSVRHLAIVSGGSQAAATWLASQQGITAYDPNSPYHAMTAPAAGYPEPLGCYLQNEGFGYEAGWANCPTNIQSSQTVMVFSAHPANSTAGESIYDSYSRGQVTQYTLGSAPSVAGQSSLTLEWSCQPSVSLEYEYYCGLGNFEHCQSDSNTNYLQNGVSNYSGSGFSPSGSYGSQTITAPSAAGTYNYSLTCNGTIGSPTITIPVTVSPPPDNCSSPLSEANNDVNSGFKLSPGSWRNIQDAQGQHVCLSNSSGNTYFVPTGSSAELTDFLNSYSQLSGVAVITRTN